MGMGPCRRRRSSSRCRSLAHSRTQTTHGPGPDHRSQPGTCRSFNSAATGTALRPQSAGHKPSPLSAQRPGRAPVRLRLQRAPNNPSSAAPRPHTRRRPQRKIPPAVTCCVALSLADKRLNPATGISGHLRIQTFAVLGAQRKGVGWDRIRSHPTPLARNDPG